MKEFFKNYYTYIIVFIIVILFHFITKSFYIHVGREQVENEFNDKMTLYKIETEKQYKIKDDLLGQAVKEKLDNREQNEQSVRKLKNEHLKYKNKIFFEFQDIKSELFKLKITNNNLKINLLEAKALNLSLSSVNKNLLGDWQLSDNNILKNLDRVMKESIAATEQKYIDFIDKIDRIKKGKK